jgi:Ser/Thr protein kinase RdoA (MazF antagonist)
LIEVAAPIQEDLARRLERRVIGWSPVAGGTQNRLFRIELSDGPPLLVKIYHRDRWNRLEREFSVLSVLGQSGVAGVPRVVFKNDELSYGVYSFEAGVVKTPSELLRNDLLAVASLVVDLQTVTPDSARGELSPAVDSGLSLAEQLRVIDSRLGAFEDFALDRRAYGEVRALYNEIDLRARITELIARTTVGISDSDRDQRLPRSAWRLNSGDFCPLNLLFAADGAVTAVDFESGGWDDPARLVMGFVASAASEDLAPDGVQTFLRAYADTCRLSAAEIARFERMGELMDLEWIAIYAAALTSDVVAAKQFANPNFDRHAYLDGATARLKRRLIRATEGDHYRFPA